MLKRVTTLVLCITGLMAMAVSANAFISFPNPSCPDSVTIYQIWQGGACKPTAGAGAVGDTVMGVGGIITAFDLRPTTYGFYMQNNAMTPEWVGMDVYCGSRNYNATPHNFALGDSVVVELGAVEDYNNSKEVLGPNGITNTNIIVRKVDSGHALPGPNVLTTSQLNWNVANTASNKYLCTFVRVNGPLIVRRTSGSNAYLVDPNHTSDTLQVFGAKFIPTGTVVGSSTALGTTVDWVQGIYENGGGTFSYEVLPRDAGDIALRSPPNMSDAYMIDDTHVRVVFDRAVETTSATDPFNYSLGSFGSVVSAVMDGTSAAVLEVNNGLMHGDAESVTVQGVINTNATPDTMKTPQTRSFINGVLTVAEASAPNPDSLLASPCVDRSKFAGASGAISLGLLGPRISVAGVVTGILNNTYYCEDQSPAATGNHGGITAFGLSSPLTVGNKYVFAGAIQEYFGETEFSSPIYVSDQGAVGTPAPISLAVTSLKDTCNAPSPNGEYFESMLVKFTGVKRVIRYDYATKPVNGFHVAGDFPGFADTVFVFNYGGALGAADSNNVNYPLEGAHVDIVGVVHYDPSFGFRLCPRNAADITPATLGVTPQAPGRLALAVSNPASRPALSFTLPVAADVELAVYDVSGRMINRLAKGHLPAASYSRTWDGRDASGHRVGAGVYFYRLSAGGEVRSTRGILLGN